MTVFFGLAGPSPHPQEAEALRRMQAAATRFWPKAVPTTDGATAQPQVRNSWVVAQVAAMPGWGDGSACVATRASGHWLLMRGLLTSRPENLLTLGHRPGTPEPSDAALALALVQRHGLACLQQLTGDWSLALWDPDQQALVLAKDPSGNCALYWWQDDAGRLLFANHLPTLMASGPVPQRPDPMWIAGLSTVFYDPAHATSTAFAKVHALPPGELLRYRKGQVERVRWWRPDQLPALQPDSDEELTERFLQLYRRAVTDRCERPQGNVAATLSGGLDSGSVVALAAPALAAQGQRLTAYVHVPRFAAADGTSGRTANEWDLACATAAHVGHVDPRACATDLISPVQAIDAWLDRLVVPSHAACHWFWLLDIAEQAAHHGASVMLTGEAGNATVSYSGNGSLWPALRHLQFGHVAAQVAQEQQGPWAGLKSRLFKPALRPAWQAWRRLCDDALRLQGAPAWVDFGLLDRGFASRTQLLSRMHAAGQDPGLRSSPPTRVRRWRAGLWGTDNTFAVGHTLGQSFGLEWRDPTKDRRLLEFCLRLPDALFWSHGQQRGLIRARMRAALPPQVLHCAAKGLQSSDLRERLSACATEVLAMTEDTLSNPTVREWFDVARMRQSALAATQAQPDLLGMAVAPAHFMRHLAAARFVARHG